MGVISGWSQAYAATRSYSVDSSYELKDSGLTVVEHEYNVKSIETGKTITVPVPGRNIEGLRVLLGSGAPVDANSEEKTYNILGRDVTLTDVKFKLNSSSDFTIKYSTKDFLYDAGKTEVFSIPVFADRANISSQSAEVKVPLAYGLAINNGHKTSDTSIASGVQSYEFNSDKSGLAEPIVLDFGSSMTAKMSLSHKLENTSWWWSIKTLVLPPDTNQQTVFIESITPQPTRIRVDGDGNVLADWRLRPKQSLEVKASVLATVRSLSYNLENGRSVEDMPKVLIGDYTRNTDRWPAGDFGDFSDTDAALERVEAIFKAVSDDKDSLLKDAGAKAKADALVGALRNAGIPSRFISGYVYHDGMQSWEGLQEHSWVESFIPGSGWMTIDPVFDKVLGSFGKADLYRLAGLIYGIDDEENLRLFETTNYEFVEEELPEADFSKGSVHQTKFVMLPGISMDRIQVQMPPGKVVDSTGVSSGSYSSLLGSLAPLQEASRWKISWLGQAFNPEGVQFGISGSDGLSEVLMQGGGDVSYIPLIILIVGGAAIIYFAVKRHRKRNGPIVLHKKKSDEDKNIDTESLLKDEKEESEQNEEDTNKAGQEKPDNPKEQEEEKPEEDKKFKDDDSLAGGGQPYNGPKRPDNTGDKPKRITLG